MHHAIWKLTALAVVVGVGTLVVVQAQRGFNQHEQAIEDGDSQAGAPEEPGDDGPAIADDVPPSQSEPELSLNATEGDAGIPVPAEMKLGGTPPRSVRPAPRFRAVDLASQTDDVDPFAEPALTEPALAEPALAEPPSKKTPAVRASRDEADGAAQALELDPPDEKEPADRGAKERPAEDAGPQTGPRLLTDRATREIKPVEESSADPFAEDVAGDDADNGQDVLDVAGATEPDPAAAKIGESGKRNAPAAAPAGGDQKDAPGKNAAPDDESGFPADETPIIERATPRRKIASPAVPQAEDEPLGVPDEMLPSEDRPADAKAPQPSKDAAPKSKNLSVPSNLVENEIPPKEGAKGEEETLTDPFSLDEEPLPAEAPPRRDPAATPDRALPDRAAPDRTLPADPEPMLKNTDDILLPADPKPKSANDGPISDEPGELLPKAKTTIPSLTIPTGPASAPAADSPIEPPDEAEAKRSAAGPEAPREAPPRAAQPQLTIEKNAPATAVLGQPMVYHIVVRNVGKVAARNVVVDEPIPDGARIDGSIPQALLQDKRLYWKLGTLEPGREKKISVRVIPSAEGTLGSVATVNFSNDAANTEAAPGPRLAVQVTAPEQAVVGTPIPFRFHVANVGPVDAGEVVIRDVLPAGLRHPDGDDLEYVVGPLAAGKSREVELTLTAAQTGKTVNRVIVTADGRVTEEASVALEVVGPTLRLERTGTRRLFPGKAGQYTNTVTNPGSAAITGVRVVETVPPGMEFVSATENGQFDATRRSLTWTIDRLEPRESRAVRVTLKSKACGPQISVVRARDAAGGSGETVGTTQVAGVPALSIELGEIPALVETGDEIRIPVRILNRGSDLATGVRTRVILPDGLELVSARAAVDYKALPAGAANEGAGETPGGERHGSAGQEIRFSPVARIDSRGDTPIELTVKALHAGTARVQVETQCDQVSEPVRREDVTTVAASEK
jgi:uncharacterized repeat protein (TIGR01451 family)